MVTVHTVQGEILTQTRRIFGNDMNLERIHLVNQLDRTVCADPIPAEKLEQEIDEIRNAKEYSQGAMMMFYGITAAIAEIEARRRKTLVLVMEVPLLIPLIPGGDLYRMMDSIMQHGISASMALIVWLVQEVFIIAAGIIQVSTVVSAYVKIQQMRKSGITG